MSVQESETATEIAPFTGSRRDLDCAVIDDSDRSLVAALETAADMANKDCVRAMELAHKLAFQLRAAEERARDAEERARQLEDNAAHLHDRAVRAEDWLQQIYREVEQTFFQKRNTAPVDLNTKPGP